MNIPSNDGNSSRNLRKSEKKLCEHISIPLHFVLSALSIKLFFYTFSLAQFYVCEFTFHGCGGGFQFLLVVVRFVRSLFDCKITYTHTSKERYTFFYSFAYTEKNFLRLNYDLRKQLVYSNSFSLSLSSFASGLVLFQFYFFSRFFLLCV